MRERLKTLYYAMLFYAPVRRCIEMIPYLGKRVLAWQRTHPFDKQYGTDTSGVVPVQMITSDKTLPSKILPYVGSQPSIIRRAIVALGDTSEYHFVDLGCGKGRVMIVASEFPFRRISGVELSPRLAKIARRNLTRVGRRFPTRPPVAVIEGNVVTFPLPEGKLVFFNYHAFGSDLLAQVINRLESFLSRGGGPIFFIYYNPVHGNLLDNSPAFTRWYAETLPYDDSELGFGPDAEDSVVIWQSVDAGTATPHAHADRPILITEPLWRAGLEGTREIHGVPTDTPQSSE